MCWLPGHLVAKPKIWLHAHDIRAKELHYAAKGVMHKHALLFSWLWSWACPVNHSSSRWQTTGTGIKYLYCTDSTHCNTALHEIPESNSEIISSFCKCCIEKDHLKRPQGIPGEKILFLVKIWNRKIRINTSHVGRIHW